MSIPLRGRNRQPSGFRRRTTLARALATFVALVVLFVSLSAEAKKKKGGKKGKTPATKSKGKSAPVDSAPETDDASSDEASSSGKSDDAAGEGEEKAKTPPPSEAGDEEPPAKRKTAKAKPAAESEEGGSVGGGLLALKLGVGGGALFRQVTWTDNRAGVLAPYTLSPGPEASVWLEAFPGAFSSDGFIANIGLFGRFNYGFGASSKTPAGATLTTKYQDFLAGIKVRIPLGMVLPYVTGAYGMQRFHLDPGDVSRPNFNYSFVNGGAGALFQLTPAFDIDLGAAYIYVLNPGSAATEIAAPAPYYPRSTAFGVDVKLSIGYRVTSLIGVRVGVDFRQIGVSTHWKSTDTSAPTGGATDRGTLAWGGLEILFDGVGGGSASESEGSAPPPAKKAAPKDAEPAGDAEPAVDVDK